METDPQSASIFTQLLILLVLNSYKRVFCRSRDGCGFCKQKQDPQVKRTGK